MAKIQTVGSLQQFLDAGKIGTSAATNSSSLLDWALHPWDSIKSVGHEALWNTMDPYLQMVTSMAAPIATIIITFACLMICFNKEKAMSWIMKSSIGYVIIMFLPIAIKSILNVV